MASTIQIKRGTGSAVPSGLADGELAINLDSGKLYFGSGSTSINNFTFGELTAEKYIVSSSVLYVTTSYSSGSTEFGDTTDDTHTFTGNITASGNISSSGTITANSFVGAATSVANALTVDDATLQLNSGTTFNGSAARTISIKDGGVDSDALASSLTLTGGNTAIQGTSQTELKIFSTHPATNRDVGLTLSASSNGQQYTLGLNRANDSFVIAPSDVGSAPNNAVFELDTHGHITASGNISASGTIFADNFQSAGGDDTISFTDDLKLVGNLTSSGNISSSGNLITTTLQFTGTDTSENATHYLEFKKTGNSLSNITNGVSINPSSDTLVLGGAGGITIAGQAGTITASGNISSSGTVTANSLVGTIGTATQGTIDHDSLANFVANEHIDHSGVSITAGAGLTGGGTIASTRDIAVGAGTGVTVNANDVAIGQDVATTANVLFNNITASGNISSSGIITGKLGTTDTNVDANHYAVIQTAVNTVPFISNALTINASSNLVSFASMTTPARKFSETSDTAGNYHGDIVYFGGEAETIAAGQIVHYKSDGNWELADADDNTKSDGLLGVALGADASVNGVLLRGMVTLDHDAGNRGEALYLTTTAGDASATAPSGNGNIVRIIGYKTTSDSEKQIWFNPDSTFVEVNA